ncbi:uncharacterized protein LOC122647382 [Telopea speciosissima]|uniref:uncharacterized protein LOC122647382 n=1 Tax=Telopea speciosissima TaxID=54955 RepID=UPI001CC33BD2|nr:uncharacterized protein LOC122647382 [Telopea speciosissima]
MEKTLPYGRLLTRIFQHFQVNLDNEPPCESFKEPFGKNSLACMKIIVNTYSDGEPVVPEGGGDVGEEASDEDEGEVPVQAAAGASSSRTSDMDAVIDALGQLNTNMAKLNSDMIQGFAAWAKEKFPNFEMQMRIRKVELEAIQAEINSLEMNDEQFTRETQAKLAYSFVVESYEKLLWAEKSRMKRKKLVEMTEHDDLLGCIPKVLEEADIFSLDSVPNNSEVKAAVWNLDPDSALRPDGFPSAFFRHCWELVGPDVCHAVRSFFTFNHIPTVTSKVMARQLERVLPKLISEEQGAFQKGKIIQDKISIALELATLMFTAKRGGGLGLKIGIQKVYDIISWNFIFNVMHNSGFSDRWINWIRQLLISTRISILVNGGPVGFYRVERGLRQGDPISPMIFIIVEEVLCRGLSKLLNDSKLRPLPGLQGVRTPGHCLFADDIFIFTNASIRQLEKYADANVRQSQEKAFRMEGKTLGGM